MLTDRVLGALGHTGRACFAGRAPEGPKLHLGPTAGVALGFPAKLANPVVT